MLSVDGAERAVGWYESMKRINNQILGGSSILERSQKARERQNRSDLLRQRETEESRFIERLVLRRKNDQQSQLLGKVQ